MSGEGRERVDVVLNGFVLDDLKLMMNEIISCNDEGSRFIPRYNEN